MIPEARFDPHGRVTLRCPYDKRLIESLKRQIPVGGREWHPETKIWVIASIWAGTAVSLARQAFPTIEVIEPEPARPRLSVVPSGDDWSVLHLRPGAPADVIDAAFKALARTHHPDRGGDTAQMQKISAAYDRLRGKTGRRVS